MQWLKLGILWNPIFRGTTETTRWIFWKQPPDQNNNSILALRMNRKVLKQIIHAKHCQIFISFPRNKGLSPNQTLSLQTKPKYVVQKRSQKFTVMSFEVFEGEPCGGFFCGNLFVTIFPRKNSLNISSQNITTFFTLKFAISKETCHLVLTLGAIWCQKHAWLNSSTGSHDNSQPTSEFPGPSELSASRSCFERQKPSRCRKTRVCKRSSITFLGGKKAIFFGHFFSESSRSPWLFPRTFRGFPRKTPPENLLRLFFYLAGTLILQGYFRDTPEIPFKTSIKWTFPRLVYLARLFLPCKVKGKN